MNVIDFRIDIERTVKARKMKEKLPFGNFEFKMFYLQDICKGKVRYRYNYRNPALEPFGYYLELPFDKKQFYNTYFSGKTLLKLHHFTKIIEINFDRYTGKWYELEYNNE